MTFSTVPAVGAKDDVLGTITTSGTAFAATAKTDWEKIEKTRPLVSGDRLKTDRAASLVADFGGRGIVGLYPESEVSVVRKEDGIVVEAQRGRVAFHLSPNSSLRVTAGGSTVTAGTDKAEGYIEYNATGAPELVVESAALNVVPAGGAQKTLVRGNRMLMTGATAEVTQVAPVDERKAAAIPEKEKRRGLSPWAWTAIAGVVAAVGIGAGVAAGGGGGGGGGDNNGSE
jgi:hypothetical protein